MCTLSHEDGGRRIRRSSKARLNLCNTLSQKQTLILLETLRFQPCGYGCLVSWFFTQSSYSQNLKELKKEEIASADTLLSLMLVLFG